MGATSEHEIERQHEEARRLVDRNLPCMDRVDRGEIPLSQKQQPVCKEAFETDEEKKQESSSDSTVHQQLDGIICVSSRGQVDVSALQDLVREGHDKLYTITKPTTVKKKQIGKKSTKSTSIKKVSYSPTNLWDPAHAAAANVCVTRPSHDAWGIGKIVLVFCDDFLQNIYEMPWWHLRADIRAAIQPIYDALDIQPSQVVRLLLASMPPGVTIPVHHDSGEWVKHTHRVHVPILVEDPDKVLFQCGPSPSQLSRVDVQPGHVFEMNNQAKHAVSNCGTTHRVHLILDYVDIDSKIHIPLSPGEVLVQTRRSVDRLCDAHSRPTPSYLILGAQKAGTTSLYEYMVQHPLVIRAKRRETHCLDWRWKEGNDEEQREHCLSFFFSKELARHSSCLTGDSTPSYLLDAKRVIPRLSKVFPHSIQYFVMMRNPVHRAYSHYQMVTSSKGTPEQLKTRGMEWRSLTFDQVVQRDIQQLQECGLIPYWDSETNKVDEEAFDAFSESTQEQEAWSRFMDTIPLDTGSHSLLARGLYELQLRPWLTVFEESQFLLLTVESDICSMCRKLCNVSGNTWTFHSIQWKIQLLAMYVIIRRTKCPTTCAVCCRNFMHLTMPSCKTSIMGLEANGRIVFNELQSSVIPPCMCSKVS